jgi:glycosyltransferase involved in cell wall biosynthesis
MKIAILGTRGLPPRYGGFETLADELGRGLAEKGHSVTVYGRSTEKQQPRKTQVVKNLFAIRSLTIKGEAFESISAGVSSSIHCIFISRPEVVLMCNPANVWSAKLLQIAGVPVVLHMAGLEHTRLKWRGLGGVVLKAAIKSAVNSKVNLLTDSMAVANWYKENYARNLSVISYGTRAPSQDQRVSEIFEQLERTYDLIVARWESDTQVAEIIQAHGKACTNQLVIVGETRSRGSEYEKLVSRAVALHPNAVVLGPIWDQEILDSLWSNCQLYIHGHRTGGTNPALLRGAAAGVEVLHHDNNFNNEVTKEFGWRWKDTAQLEDLLMKREWEKHPRNKLLSTSVIETYRWPQIVTQYEELFNELKGGKD